MQSEQTWTQDFSSPELIDGQPLPGCGRFFNHQNALVGQEVSPEFRLGARQLTVTVALTVEERCAESMIATATM